MPVAILKNLDLYYEIHGSAEAAPLVLLHGAMETFDSGWKGQLSAFGEAYQVIGVDLRGHGRSTNPANQLDLRQMADDILNLIQHLGHEKIHLLGFSGGASVALFFAHRHPTCLSSLILVSNNMERDHARTTQNFWDVDRIRRQNPRWWNSLADLHKFPAEKILQWWAEEDTKRPDFEAAELAHIDAPTLVMSGDRDEITPLEQTLLLFGALPQAQLAILPGLGHGVPKRRPKLFNALVLDFLANVRSSS